MSRQSFILLINTRYSLSPLLLLLHLHHEFYILTQLLICLSFLYNNLNIRSCFNLHCKIFLIMPFVVTKISILHQCINALLIVKFLPHSSMLVLSMLWFVMQFRLNIYCNVCLKTEFKHTVITLAEIWW